MRSVMCIFIGSRCDRKIQKKNGCFYADRSFFDEITKNNDKRKIGSGTHFHNALCLSGAKGMDMIMTKIKRGIIYMIGILFVSLGIVLCKKCGMGISPISSIPFVLALITPLTFGNLTTLFHFFNTLLQMIFSRSWRDLKLWMQIPLALVFGWIIDIFNTLIVVDADKMFVQAILLIFSIVFTAFGMVCMLEADLIQNPPDGTVKMISFMLKKELGATKNVYDFSCIFISMALGLIYLHDIEGFGIATIVSAIFVGKAVRYIQGILLWR